jgi:hypothetical protein
MKYGSGDVSYEESRANGRVDDKNSKKMFGASARVGMDYRNFN